MLAVPDHGLQSNAGLDLSLTTQFELSKYGSEDCSLQIDGAWAAILVKKMPLAAGSDCVVIATCRSWEA